MSLKVAFIPTWWKIILHLDESCQRYNPGYVIILEYSDIVLLGPFRRYFRLARVLQCILCRRGSSWVQASPKRPARVRLPPPATLIRV